jgi:hypothetical protein
LAPPLVQPPHNNRDRVPPVEKRSSRSRKPKVVAAPAPAPVAAVAAQ